MQRRAATVSVAVFLLLAAGAYSYIGVAQQPDIELDSPDHRVSAGEETIEGTTYNFTDVGDSSATATWVNESARYTAAWAANDTVPYADGNYTVVIPEQDNYDMFRLVENQTVDRPTVEQNGTTYVIVEEDGERRLVERSEYLGPPTEYEFQVGDPVNVTGNANETTVAAVSASEVTVEWFAPRTNELGFAEGENTTIGGTPYLAHFEGDGTMVLTTAYQDYHSDVSAQQTFHERMKGLWGIVILSGLAAALLVMLAFMPSRY